MCNRLSERHRQTERHVAAERIAVPGCVFGGDMARLAAELHLDRSACAGELVDPLPGRAIAAHIDFGGREIADLAQHVVQLVCAASTTAIGDALQFELHIGQYAGVEQLAQLLGAQQVAQQITVERQSSGAALGQRCIALVHVRGDPVEQQALGERRRLGGIDADHAHGATAQLAEHVAQPRQVEHVLEALARCLQQDRERRVLGGDRQQVGGALALLPQGCAPVGSTTRQ